MTVTASYVLITPAHNEEAFIEGTIRSVAAQSVLPLRWVIVNDASTDRTKEVIERCCAPYDFIRLLNLERPPGRHFGRKAIAFHHGLEQVRTVNYEFVGNLDADIILAPDYFDQILRNFDADPQLGIGGGIVYTKVGDKFSTGDTTLDSVGGAVQMFRKDCFRQVGGYLALEKGGIDAAAEIMARMKGWKVRKFPENKVYEQRRTGTGDSGVMQARFREGRHSYGLGYGALFFAARCAYRLKDRPVLVGSVASLLGFLSAMLRRDSVVLPKEVVAFLRVEQREKLRRAATAIFGCTSQRKTRNTGCS